MSRPEPSPPPPGRLWPRVRERAERALALGAIEPITTESTVIEDGGVPFLVRVVSSLEKKARADAARKTAPGGGNPFLPYDPDLFVADLSPTHLCLLNRFKVVDHHLLAVTRAFEEQESLLGREDFEALWRLLAEIDGLGFYNSGPDAGASQRHKHLQVVPVPVGAGPGRTPVDEVLAAARYRGAAGRADLPFVHAVGRLPPGLHLAPEEAAAASLALYRQLLAAAFPGSAAPDGRAAGPYNLLVTRDWMLLAPRSRCRHAGIEVNALGYAGSLLLRRGEQLEPLRRLGPLSLLLEVGVTEVAG